MQSESIGCARYLACFEDVWRTFRRVLFLKTNSDVEQTSKTFMNEAGAAGYKINKLLRDGGEEFDNTGLKAFRIRINSYSEINGAANVENRSLVLQNYG